MSHLNRSNQLLVRKASLCKYLDTTANGLTLLQKRYPDFPRPIKFGDSRQAAVYFDVAEVRRWIDSRKADRDSTAA